LLAETGWQVGCDRVQRIWRREGLKVPRKQRPRGRLWLNDGSCIRLRPQHRDHVWSYDFVEAQTHDGRKLRFSTTKLREKALVLISLRNQNENLKSSFSKRSKIANLLQQNRENVLWTTA
jgi:hypothetical protein